ncbi:hypothetical protein MNBD_GAMMA22-417 [hydrothermal vent metagenome]|uniref:Uncharacterized protein n=1 Tax=hydrothermal vent metagenome TaxID=652676 RepID=A0A3B1AV80_9ZZZZ
MDESTTISIFSWLADHPILFGLTIFFIALIESLALVGILVPGIVLMLLIGAYLATSQFSFFYAVILAFAGAIAGDSISYYLGYHYKNKLITLWPISRYPEAFQKGINFFKRHGYKSIILGRFIGPLRPIVPAIAGMFQMPRAQFFISNVFSASIWAPVVLLPGFVIGLSLEYASDIAGRLIILVIVTGTLLWVIFWLIKTIYISLLPRIDKSIALLLQWSHKHPITGKVPRIILDNKYSDKNLFSLLSILFLIFSYIFFILPLSLGIFEQANDIDIFLKDIFLNFNSPISDSFVVILLNLTGLRWLLFLAFFTLVLTILNKNTFLYRYFILNFILISILQILLTQYFTIDKNLNLSTSSIYLFLTFILTFNNSTKRKIFYYGICYTLISTVMLALIYYGNENVLPLILTSGFSFIWVVLLTSGYRHHNKIKILTLTFQNKVGLALLLIFLLKVFILPNSFYITKFKKDTLVIENSIWTKFAWKNLPSHRVGFINKTKHPFNIQWLGTKQDIIQSLTSNSEKNRYNWLVSPPATLSNVLQLLNTQATTKSLAIYPHLHNGKYEQLRFINHSKTDEILVIRLWQTSLKIKKYQPEQNAKPLWQGTLTKLSKVNTAGVVMLQTSLINATALNIFASDLSLRNLKVIHRKNAKFWNTVMLISN